MHSIYVYIVTVIWEINDDDDDDDECLRLCMENCSGARFKMVSTLNVITFSMSLVFLVPLFVNFLLHSLLQTKLDIFVNFWSLTESWSLFDYFFRFFYCAILFTLKMCTIFIVLYHVIFSSCILRPCNAFLLLHFSVLHFHSWFLFVLHFSFSCSQSPLTSLWTWLTIFMYINHWWLSIVCCTFYSKHF